MTSSQTPPRLNAGPCHPVFPIRTSTRQLTGGIFRQPFAFPLPAPLLSPRCWRTNLPHQHPNIAHRHTHYHPLLTAFPLHHLNLSVLPLHKHRAAVPQSSNGTEIHHSPAFNTQSLAPNRSIVPTAIQPCTFPSPSRTHSSPPCSDRPSPRPHFPTPSPLHHATRSHVPVHNSS